MRKANDQKKAVAQFQNQLAAIIVESLIGITYEPNLQLPGDIPIDLTTPMDDDTHTQLLNYQYYTGHANDWMLAITVDHVLRRLGYPSFFVEKNDRLPHSIANLTVSQATGQAVIIDMPQQYKRDPYLSSLQKDPTFEKLVISKYQFETQYPHAIFYNVIQDSTSNSVKRRDPDDIRNSPQTALKYFPNNLLYFKEESHETSPSLAQLIYHLLEEVHYDPEVLYPMNNRDSAYKQAVLARIIIGNREPTNDKMITLALHYLATINNIPTLLTGYTENGHDYWGLIYYDETRNDWLYTNPTDQLKVKLSLSPNRSVQESVTTINQVLQLRDQDKLIRIYAQRHPGAVVYPPFYDNDTLPMNALQPMNIKLYQHLQEMTDAMEQKIEYPSSYLKKKNR